MPSQDAAVTTGEPKLTERKIVSQTTYVTGSDAHLPERRRGFMDQGLRQRHHKAKTTYGSRFLAASCGEPTYDGSATYTSSFTTWLVL